MTRIFDIAIIGAGVVGSALARELAQYNVDVVLLESNPDVGMGTSKASTAIWHTGFDAKPGSLEAALMRRSYPLMDRFMPAAGIPHERLGAILIAWNQEQVDALPGLLKKAHENGVLDAVLIDTHEIYRREPYINQAALGGLLVPGEGILCTFSLPLALATQAVNNGVVLKVNFQVESIQLEADHYIINSPDDMVQASWVVNCAGLFSDEINAHFGHRDFTVTPRRGQLIIYDKFSRPLVNHVLLPVPTAKTKGVLISPTVYGNVLLGPTAEDLPDKTATQTTAGGLQMLLDKGRAILPELLSEEVTSTYAGLRAATEHTDYQIVLHAEQRYLCVGGIRSTGVSAAMGIAEYSVDLLISAGLDLARKPDFKPVRIPTISQTETRPYQDAGMIAANPLYGEMVCHCERVSRGEINDALNASIPATTLDGIRRRTRASQGRCQGFNCHATLSAAVRNALSETRLPALPKKPILQNSARETEVLIIGAGPAGLAAAIALKQQGIREVLVVDREAEAGGMPRMCDHIGFGRADLHWLYSGPGYARHYRELAEKAGVEIVTSTTITKWEEPGTGKPSHSLAFTSPGGRGAISARTVLLATGVRERPRAARLVPGTRPQGIYTTGSLQRFVYQEHLPVGKTAVIVGAELVSLSALLTLMHAGLKCNMMVTEQPRHQIYFPYLPAKWAFADLLARIPILTGARVTDIFGLKRLEGLELTHASGQTERIACDTLVFTGNWIPENELARLGGLAINPGSLGPQVDAQFRSSVPGVFAAGNLLHGVDTADHCALEGQHVALALAAYLKDGIWPEDRLKLVVEAPLKFIVPNVITDQSRAYFQFQSNEFRRNVEICIQQADRVLHTQAFPNLIVNEFMRLPAAWVDQIDRHGPEVRVSIQPH